MSAQKEKEEFKLVICILLGKLLSIKLSFRDIIPILNLILSFICKISFKTNKNVSTCIKCHLNLTLNKKKKKKTL